MDEQARELVWINGRVLPLAQAQVGVEDRGFQFADGVYEVIRVYNGTFFALDRHLDRLERSLDGIRLSMPMPRARLAGEMRQLLAASGVSGGMIYLQITRGGSPRNHLIPQAAQPTVLFYARALPDAAGPGRAAGLKLKTTADDRWKRCWIKSIALLPNLLAKNAAHEAGFDEAVFVDQGQVTECSASNILLVVEGRLIAPPPGAKVLPGITRAVLVECAAACGIPVEERLPPLAQAKAAAEVFVTSTTRELAWVERWDEQVIGTGRCGPVARRLHDAYRQEVERECGRLTPA